MNQTMYFIDLRFIPRERISFKASEGKWTKFFRDYFDDKKVEERDEAKILCITPGKRDPTSHCERIIDMGEDVESAPKLLADFLGVQEKTLLFEAWNADPRFGDMYGGLTSEMKLPENVQLIIFFPGLASDWDQALKDRFHSEFNLKEFSKSLKKEEPNLVFMGSGAREILLPLC